MSLPPGSLILAPFPRPRYRVICYELTGEREELIVDVTDQGFLLATGNFTGATMEGELCHAGPRELQTQLALLLARIDYLASVADQLKRR